MKYNQNQIETIKKLIIYNGDNTENYLNIKHNLLEYIFKLDISPNSKLLLLYFLKKVSLDLKHLYVITPHKNIIEDLGISKSTSVKCINELSEKKLIIFLSGKEKQRNTDIKEFIFGQKQYKLYTPNQHNIIDMSIFYQTYFNLIKKS